MRLRISSFSVGHAFMSCWSSFGKFDLVTCGSLENWQSLSFVGDSWRSGAGVFLFCDLIVPPTVTTLGDD